MSTETAPAQSHTADKESAATKPKHPTYLSMVLQAIEASGMEASDAHHHPAVSRQHVHSWIRDHYPMLPEKGYDARVNKAIQTGIDNKQIKVPAAHTGSLSLTPGKKTKKTDKTEKVEKGDKGEETEKGGKSEKSEKKEKPSRTRTRSKN
jgi:hypothetical protein